MTHADRRQKLGHRRRRPAAAPNGFRATRPECEMIAMSAVNDADERLLRNDVRYRFVIDMSRGL